MTGKEDARARGYISGLKGASDQRLIFPPDYRFAYDAGRRDGERCKQQ